MGLDIGLTPIRRQIIISTKAVYIIIIASKSSTYHEPLPHRFCYIVAEISKHVSMKEKDLLVLRSGILECASALIYQARVTHRYESVNNDIMGCDNGLFHLNQCCTIANWEHQ